MADIETKSSAALVKAEKEAKAKAAEESRAAAHAYNDRRPHLDNSKAHFVELLKERPAHEHHALAKNHGWRLLSVVCGEPVPAEGNYAAPSLRPRKPCGYVLKDHVVDFRSSVADDLRVLKCPKCGARGNWAHSEAAKPAKDK